MKPVTSAIAMFGAVTAIAVSGCGSDTKTVTETTASSPATTTSQTTTDATSNLTPVSAPLSANSVKRCLNAGGAVVTSSGPLLPAGNAVNAPAVFALGPSGARIGVVLTFRPVITNELARQLAASSKYEVNTAAGERALVMFDPQATIEDKALASKCVGS